MSDLIFLGVRQQGASPVLEAARGEGTLNHGEDTITATLAGVAFSDQDGADLGTRAGSRVYRDGSRELTIISDDPDRPDNIDFFGGFVFVQPSTGVGPPDSTAFGVVGVGTAPDDMPSGGTATYTGLASVEVDRDAGFADVGEADARITADFGAGTVNVTIDNFRDITGSSGPTTTVAFDEVVLSDMAISGNRFSGGTFETRDAGTAVTPIGPIVSTVNEGGFFGFDDSIGAPDEVAGFGSVQNASSERINANFGAD